MKFTTSLFLLWAVVPCFQACPFRNGDGPNPHLSENDEGNVVLPKHMAERSLQDRFTGTPAQAITAAKQDIVNLIDQTGRLGPKFVRLGFHDCVGECFLLL